MADVKVADPFKQYIDVDPDSEPSRQSYIKFVEEKSPHEVKWWSKETVAVVTGGNKGIGFEIVRQLADAGVTTILTARDEGRGLAATKALKAQGLENVLFYPLDVTSPVSAGKLAKWIKEKFGGIDILVGNAGVSTAGLEPSHDTKKFILTTNFDGQKIVTSALLPLFKSSPSGARIVLVSSELGQLQYIESEKLREQLNDVEHLTEEELDSLRDKYMEKGVSWATGFAEEYKVSKVLLNAYSRILAKSCSSRPSDSKIYVNVMSPGLTTTDLNGNMPGRSLKHAADTAVWLALLPSGGPNGGFLRDRADYPF